MARMRLAKKKVREWLQAPDWREHVPEIARGGMESVGPLFSLLPLEPEIKHRAAFALGRTCARLALEQPEAGRNVMRRFLWHMNEESGNIGWGVPEAFGECLAASPRLAGEFHRLLLSTVIDLGREDNFCANDVLRRGCFWAIGRLAEVRPELCVPDRAWLRKGLEDRDEICRGLAAWAIGRLPRDINDVPALRRLAGSACATPCPLFDGEKLYSRGVSELAQEALAGAAKGG